MHAKNIERYREHHQELLDEQAKVEAKIKKLDEDINTYTK